MNGQVQDPWDSLPTVRVAKPIQEKPKDPWDSLSTIRVTKPTQNIIMGGAQKAVAPYEAMAERGRQRFSPEYWKQLFTSDYWDETWGRLKKYPGQLVAPVVEAAKKPIGPVEPSPWAAQYGLPMKEVEHPITGEGRRAVETKETGEGLKSVGKTAFDFAAWLPRLMIDLYKDPLKTIKERAGDLILVGGTPLVGRAIKGVAGKLKAGQKLTPPEIIAAQEEAVRYQSTLEQMAKTSARKPGDLKNWAEMPTTAEEAAIDTARIQPVLGEMAETSYRTPGMVKTWPEMEWQRQIPGEYGMRQIEDIFENIPEEGVFVKGKRGKIPKQQIKPSAEQPPIIPEPTKPIPPVYMSMPMDVLTDYASKGVQGAKDALAVRGPKGLSVQPIGEKGPMTMAEAMKATPKPRGEVPPAIKPSQQPKPTLDAFDQALVDVLKTSAPMRKKQADLYKEEWARRFAAGETAAEGLTGKAYLAATRAAAAGEMPKVRFGSVAERFPPELQKIGYRKVTDAVASLGEKWTMEKGLDKIFDPRGGQVPTTLELELLHKIVAPEVIEQLLRKREAWPKFRDTLYEVANVPRAIMASFDLSFPFRQGIFLGAGHPKEFGTAFAEQIKYFGSENAFRVGMEEITSRPTYRYMLKGPGREHGIAFTEMGKILGLREERFLSPLAEKIQILGHGVRASGRAYTGFRNRFSADVFDSLFTDAEKMGLNPARNPVLLDKMSEFINIASGRGSSKSLGHSAMILNSIFFSPRLMLSRLQLFNPHTYLKLPKPVRLDSVKCLAGFIGAGSTILTLSKLAGADVTLDPRSSDFAKIKIGNTRIDTWGGFQQYVRAAAQLVSGKVVSTQTGKVTELGSKFGSPTRLDIAARSLGYKTTPLISLAMNMLRGKTVFGEKLKLLPTFKGGIMDWESGEILSRFIPMVVQDFEDLARDDPKLTPLLLLGIVGFGLQTYKPRPTKPGSQYFYMK